jgi:hypothetical protein
MSEGEDSSESNVTGKFGQRNDPAMVRRNDAAMVRSNG